jgi:tetratricopeptide (TPR) repeat protein
MSWWWLWPLVVGGWVVLDIQALMRWQTDLNALAAAGRFERIPAHCNAMLHSWRPFIRLLRVLTMPGVMEAMCALQFHTLGDHAHALELARLAEKKGASRPTSLTSALAVQVLALTALRRFDEGNAVFARLKELPGASPGLLSSGITLLLAQGRLEDAIAAANLVLSRDPADEAAHLSLSAASLELGRFPEALAHLDYQPRGATIHHTPADLKNLRASDEGKALLAASEASRSAVVKPSPHIQAALVHLEAGDVNAAEFSLSQAAAVLGNHHAVNVHFHGAAARAAALQADVVRAEKHLAQGAALLARLPRSVGLALEWRLAESRALLALNRPGAALESLKLASDLNPTPLHRHHLHALWAQAANAQGDHATAREQAQRVLQDGLPGLATTRTQRLLESLPAA